MWKSPTISKSLVTYISSPDTYYTILTDRLSLIREKETHTKACKYLWEVSKQIAFSNGIHCAEWRAHLWVPGGRGFQHFTPSELLQWSSYNVTFVALKPYPMWSTTLQKITLLNVAVKTGIENNSKSRDYVYGLWQYKILSNYIYKILQTE